MDLLCRAYGNSSDEEEGNNLHPTHPFKRSRSEGNPCHGIPSWPEITSHGYESSGLSRETSVVAGRYISKRERAMFSASSRPPDSPPMDVKPLGTLPDLHLPGDISMLLKSQRKTNMHFNDISESSRIVLNGHIKAVNSIQWSQSHAHLLASAGMDQSVFVWNVWSKDQKRACSFSHHKAAVKDVRWCPQGLFLLSCGYDCSSRLTDIEKGVETQIFKEDQVVDSIRFHPENPNLFLSGGLKGFLRLWDTRVEKVVHEYLKHLGPILDVEFSTDGKYFISSTDTSRSNISENAIIIWDVSRQIPLSNQVYTEAFTCPCVRYHPVDASFVAQSNGNYIAIFSASPPFKLDRYKRYESHGVWGYPIKCNFSRNGKELASGSSDGHIYFYDYKSTRLIQKVKAFEEPCLDVAFHPSIPNVVASCSWSGEISVFH
ncbi:Protein Mut11 [Apostasia shenzhenica]|uniref:Protein Mut11 n=1 Tax=Apostasia shenzhenica TaxID=1088818 RepID=A0A2I0A3H3_9ASPA|nr:Protein Mut11 [Apostasia shenzhenica]